MDITEYFKRWLDNAKTQSEHVQRARAFLDDGLIIYINCFNQIEYLVPRDVGRLINGFIRSYEYPPHINKIKGGKNE